MEILETENSSGWIEEPFLGSLSPLHDMQDYSLYKTIQTPKIGEMSHKSILSRHMSHDTIFKSASTTFRTPLLDHKTKSLKPIIRVSTPSMTTDSKTKLLDLSEKFEPNMLNVRNLSIPEENTLQMPMKSLELGLESQTSLTDTDEKYSLTSSRSNFIFYKIH